MINVKRIDCPDVLKTGQTPASKGEVETQSNLSLAASDRSYNAYRDKAVRKALKRMFNGKCAYCESRITAIYSGDIEHFRPKGGGYFWLAADWENLLFACPFCNQTHTHEIVADGVIREVVQGKREQFPLGTDDPPLNNNHARLFFSNDPLDKASYKNAFTQEESIRLLLRPCTDEHIEAFFKYSDQGVMLVGDGLKKFEQTRAETSIKVYALQRLGLVQEREAKVIQVKAQIKRVENAIHTFNKYYDSSEEERIFFEGIVRREMKILQQFKEPDQEYAGLARYIINKYFEQFNAQ